MYNNLDFKLAICVCVIRIQIEYAVRCLLEIFFKGSKLIANAPLNFLTDKFVLNLVMQGEINR